MLLKFDIKSQRLSLKGCGRRVSLTGEKNANTPDTSKKRNFPLNKTYQKKSEANIAQVCNKTKMT